ncbi:sodium:proton antiporter [Oceanispirochaeta sp.]|jgi:multisubunit Na+/H+ antiporter MnhC subunit|uniref:sodium:proton antiporter n=1 Tax=Oceanispirochaeta sp. TaxID=2035350 RepID=UPI002602CF26|nr:sodium:proton antiporter [Oceanispirochaeta sp.]MDA3955732.1 sodium:proton antiporter [Oceanispirochaeta sp.]
MSLNLIATLVGFALLIVGLWGILTRKSIIKMVIGFSIMDTGIHLVIVSLGYIQGRTAPIIDASATGDPVLTMVDPIPSALVLTAIVIGLAVTALMLSYAVRLYKATGTSQVQDIKELKW